MPEDADLRPGKGQNSMQRDMTIIVGAFGSGKTETAINLAIRQAARRNGHRTALVDIDIVNPYFRSREEEEYLSRYGISVISTSEESRQADLPALSPRIYSVLQDHSYDVVFDVGGDPTGARVLGRYAPYFQAEPDYQMHLVINPYRPMTSTPDEIKAMADAIELRSRLAITSLVCNAHLRAETTWEVVERGYGVVRQASDLLKLPIAYVCVPSWLAASREAIREPLFPLQLFMLPPWEKEEASPSRAQVEGGRIQDGQGDL